MIWILLVAHLVGVVAVLSLPSPRPAFAVALAAPLASAVWAASRLGVGEIDTARQCLRLLDALDCLDDVRSVSANLDLADELEID